MMRIWEQREKLNDKVQSVSLGKSGGIYASKRREQGAEFGNYLSKGVRAHTKEDVETGEKIRYRGETIMLSNVYNDARQVFEDWRRQLND